ncbi:uncharacterized protein LOC135141084 [Zophobas morio]|uniref:uncharacterized protein LOC135141084 n=1 Tax=Zophobas morio TaxID=2755281 RepID=UPI003082F4AC
MFLGGGYMEGMNLTKVSHKGWYTIGIKKLKLGNHTIKASSPEAIVDSGSTLFIVDVHVLRQITHILCPIVLPNEPLLDCHEKLIGKKSLPIGQDVINRCPILRVLVPDYLEPFTNFELSFKPSDYWLGDGKNYLLGISGGNSMILGGTVLRLLLKRPTPKSVLQDYGFTNYRNQQKSH